MSESFSKQHRLLTPESFSEVLKGRAKRVSSQYFTILYKNNSESHPRLGLAIAKRLVKKAVGRNRIKRVAREVCRKKMAGLGGVDIVILARNGVGALDKAQLHVSLNYTWQKLCDQYKVSLSD